MNNEWQRIYPPMDGNVFIDIWNELPRGIGIVECHRKLHLRAWKVAARCEELRYDDPPFQNLVDHHRAGKSYRPLPWNKKKSGGAPLTREMGLAIDAR